MINHKVVQPNIYVVMSCLITNLASNLLVQFFLQSVNIWQSYKQNG